MLEQRKNQIDDLQGLLSASRVERFSYAEELAKDKSNLQSTLQSWLTFWRDVMLQVAGSSAPLTNIDRQDEISTLAKKAQEGSIGMEELTGGTFTITNGGIFGSMMSTPILNQPQSAILGMHSIKERPVVVDGEIVIRPVMYVALSYDHRLVDGREAVLFLVTVKEMLEDPARLLHFRLVFDFCFMRRCEVDDLAKELFIHLA